MNRNAPISTRRGETSRANVQAEPRLAARLGAQGLRRIAGALTLLMALAAVVSNTVVPNLALGASFQVSPTRFEFKLNKRFTNSFTVTNNSEKKLRIRVFTSFLDVDDSNKLVPVKNHQLDLSKYVVLNPRKFTLRPGQKRVVRFSVRRPPATLKPGEHRVVVFFAELPGFSGRPPPKQSAAPGTLGGMRIELLTRLGITMYGMKGEPKLRAELESAKISLKPSQVILEGKAVNKGNVRIPLTLKARLVDLNGKEWHAGRTNIFIQQQQWRGFKLVLPKPPKGSYRILFNGSSGKKVFFKSSLPFETTASPQ